MVPSFVLWTDVFMTRHFCSLIFNFLAKRRPTKKLVPHTPLQHTDIGANHEKTNVIPERIRFFCLYSDSEWCKREWHGKNGRIIGDWRQIIPIPARNWCVVNLKNVNCWVICLLIFKFLTYFCVSCVRPPRSEESPQCHIVITMCVITSSSRARSIREQVNKWTWYPFHIMCMDECRMHSQLEWHERTRVVRLATDTGYRGTRSFTCSTRIWGWLD